MFDTPEGISDGLYPPPPGNYVQMRATACYNLEQKKRRIAKAHFSHVSADQK